MAKVLMARMKTVWNMRTQQGYACTHGNDDDGQHQGLRHGAQVVAAEEAVEELVVVVFDVFVAVRSHLALGEVGQQEAQHVLAEDDDEEEVGGAEHGAVGRGDDVGGVVDAQGHLDGGEVGVAAGVEAREHAADGGEGLAVVAGTDEEADDYGNTTACNA